MDTLTDREISIINLRYFNRLTLKQVSIKVNVTPQWVCEITKEIINKINKCMAV